MREVATGQQFALKALHKRHLIAESAVELVYKERDMLAEIGHCRYIANLRGYTQDSSRLYFLLELATGGDLRGALKAAAAAGQAAAGAGEKRRSAGGGGTPRTPRSARRQSVGLPL